MNDRDQHEAFLLAIIANPDDDLPRLVFADWLDENGQPERAEFIRLQIALARMADDSQRRELRDRERALLAEHREQWRLPQFPDQVQTFRRGFVERIAATGEWLLAHPDCLPAAPMVRELKIVNAASAGLGLAALPGLEQIVHLDLSNTLPGYGFSIPDFLTAARLDRLKVLNLGVCGFWEWAVPALMDVRRLRQLDRLDLWGNPFSDGGAEVIANSPNLANLTALDLSAHEQQPVYCMHADGAAALANSIHLTRLRDFDLTDHYIGDAGLISLVNSPNARSLERLVVAYNEIGILGDSGIEAVVESQYLRNLRELVLVGNRLNPLGAEKLAAWPHLEQMRFVDLRECDLGSITYERLMRSQWAEKFVL
jgi:uncharacterized protein (TIGR02996 family)